MAGWSYSGQNKYEPMSAQYPTAQSTQLQQQPLQMSTYQAGPMENLATQYYQKYSQQPVYTAQQQQGLENRLTNQLNTQLAAAQEGMAGMYGAGGQSGAMRDAMNNLYLQGMAGRGNILSDVGLQLAGQEAQNKLAWGNLGQGMAGTLGGLQLNREQAQNQNYWDATQQQYYNQQLQDQMDWINKLMGLYGNNTSTGGWGMNTAPLVSY